jgi:hypothetical protein
LFSPSLFALPVDQKFFVMGQIAFFSCAFFFNVDVLSQAQEYGFNMDTCSACGEKVVCHTASGKEKQCKTRKQPNLQTVLWKF